MEHNKPCGKKEVSCSSGLKPSFIQSKNIPKTNQQSKRRKTCVALTGHTERCGAAVISVLIGGFAGEFATVVLGWAQDLQRGRMVAADNPVLIAIFDLVSILEPLEVHIWCLLGFTVKLGTLANIDLHRHNFVPEHRFHWVLEGEGKKKKVNIWE